MFLKTTGKYLSSYEILYYDEANSRYLWTYGGNNALTAAVGHPIKLRYDTGGSWSSVLLPTGYVYNEHEFYTTTIDSLPYFVWWSPTLNWVISKYLGYGTNEYQESTVWKGDYWWNGANLTGTTGSPTIFNKRGAGKQAANNKKDYYVAAGQMEGWTKSGTTIPGEYAPISGSSASGNKWIGWKVMQDATLAQEFIQNEELTNTKESYAGTRNIWWSSSIGKWIISAAIGTADTLVGYWSCSTLIGTYTRTYTGEGTAPLPVQYSITVKEYRALSTTHDAYPIYMGQVAVWF